MPNTVGEALRWGIGRLRPADEAPGVTAAALLEHVLRQPRTSLLAHPERPLEAGAAAAYEALVERAAAGEPLAYLTGRREFYGLEFEVDSRVLVPRPETELLVERALLRLAGRPEARVLDVGSGSGCIAVTLAVKAPRAQVTAVDLSAAALEVAQANARRHGVAGRIHFALSDLLENAGPGPFDLLCANLPYVPAAEVAHRFPWGRSSLLQRASIPAQFLPTAWGAPQIRLRLARILARSGWLREFRVAHLPVARHEPRLALDGGPDGLRLIRRLLAEAPRVMAAGGVILLEIGHGQGEGVSAMADEVFGKGKGQREKDKDLEPAVMRLKNQDAQDEIPGAGEMRPGSQAAEVRVSVHRDLAGLERMVEIELPA